jgi:hypothetical protein
VDGDGIEEDSADSREKAEDECGKVMGFGKGGKSKRDKGELAMRMG